MSVNGSVSAEVYDLMAANNPAYQELLAHFETELKTWSPELGTRLADLGAGTGNFSLKAAQIFPHGHVLHVDADPGMLSHAKEKGERAGITNVRYLQADPEMLVVKPQNLSAIISIHAFCALKMPQVVMKKMLSWLQPGGRVYLCDLGRSLDTPAWKPSLLRAYLKPQHWRQAFASRLYQRLISRENKRTTALQKKGFYWTHSHDAFVAAMKEAGFEILRHEETYRGSSDLVIAQKPNVALYPPNKKQATEAGPSVALEEPVLLE